MFAKVRVVSSRFVRIMAVAQAVAGAAVIPLVVSSVAVADTAEITSSRDNTIFEEGALSNGAGSHFFAGTTNAGDVRRGLIAFDLEGSIPAGSVINSVTLTLSMSRTIAGQMGIELRRATAGWGEGTSQGFRGEGGGSDATPGDATWTHRFFDTDEWSSPGGDFASVSATVTIGDVGSYTWASTPQMVEDVQSWLDDPASNFGWLLKASDEGPTLSAKRFDSRENPAPASRPRLSIDFSPPLAGTSFRRGDANIDGAVDVSDVVFTLLALAGNPGSLPCGDAADSNDDAAVDISDAVATLMDLFSGVPIPDPGAGSCSVDPTEDELDCAEYAAACP